MVYNAGMSEAVTYPKYPEGVEPRSRRPRGTSSYPTLGELFRNSPIDKMNSSESLKALGELLRNSPPTDDWQKNFDEILRDYLKTSNQPLDLSQAIRNYFQQKGIHIVGIYRLGRYAIEVVFRYGDKAYWEIKSSAPPLEDWDIESLDDWLYGDLIEVQLPKKLEQINSRLNK